MPVGYEKDHPEVIVDYLLGVLIGWIVITLGEAVGKRQCLEVHDDTLHV